MNDVALSEIHKSWHGSLRSYVIGFVVSILLTLVAYFVVALHLLADWRLLTFIFGLGIAQAVFQLLFFLHLGKETRPRWSLVVFGFMLLLLVILVLGSLWIMYNLDGRVMPAMQ